jgi:hypothetical protein
VSRPRPHPRPPRRWECACQHPPVLLATFEGTETLNLKIRDRYYHIVGTFRVQATCPRCGRVHTTASGPIAS